MVIWTPRARADLKDIHDHIAQDAPMNAKRVVADIAEKAGTLSETPRMGKIVPEVQDDRLREIHVHAWRVLYHISDQHVYIVTLVHKRRQLKEQDIPTI